MKQKVCRFFFSACLYWVFASFASELFPIPPKTIGTSTFTFPILGMLWGPTAAAGTFTGGLLAVPALRELFASDITVTELVGHVGRTAWIPLGTYLPCMLWSRLTFGADRLSPTLKVITLVRFIAVLFLTFLATSLLRTWTVSPTELSEFAERLGLLRATMNADYFAACFMNDFCWALFIDLVWFFYLVSQNYTFYRTVTPPDESPEPADEPLSSEEHHALILSMRCYFLFPALVLYLDVFQIYGMEHIETWLQFVFECLSMMDVYLVMMLYLLLNYRRSIMMEIVFLVALTVFMSAAVLGWGSSVAMSNIVKHNTDNSLRAMSVICRERLDRTFFCVRQAVNGMERQARHAIESYDRLRDDATYREQYLSVMRQRFDDIARGTDGSITYYLHLAPEFGGTAAGFFMAREDPRWEGALPPFVSRPVTDLALYSPDNFQHVGWYYTPKEIERATWIEPYIDPTTNSYVISYVAPILVGQRFVGVIGIEIDFNFIIQELRRMSIYDYGYVYIMNRNNIVLYHKDQPQGSVFESNPEFQELEIYLANGMWLGIAIPMSRIHEERNRIIMHLVTAILIVAMMISLGSIALASKAIKPLAGMTEAAKRIASGDLNVKISYESGNELGLLVRSIREMAAKLEIYVYRDKLTGLRNAAAYIGKRAELEARIKSEPDLKFGVVIFDANFLKKVNDKYGHGAGNDLIRTAAMIIAKVFANSPVYRVGGDEFAAILEGEDYERREELLIRFDEKTAEEHIEAAGDRLEISIARGLGIYEVGMALTDVTKRADDEMYKHKAAIKAKYGEEVR